jgi:serine/threonine protein kinase
MTEVSPDIRAIFCKALELASAEEVSQFLNDVCRDDVKLRREVQALLSSHREAGNFLGGLPTAESTIESSPIAERPGTQIGPYKLLQQIGEGGYGVVFVAEQERPVKRRVALKVIKPGMDTREVIARFEAERQALAMMDHPNIAKVYDAGATENGRPYFVMELVQGVPITEYCDQCNLPTRERLELFVTVCQAVQHAHQKGVIHRDIKPTNVLVAIQDGCPAPKIIDFGVAKAISQRLTERTLMTAFAQIVGTPLYMSPEQAELSAMGVDTRTDMYSLGVLLYELLTGTTPFDKNRLHAASYDEFRRIIREEEPPRPSARISTLAADLAITVADHRRTDARRLCQTVSGELDWIVMKCLEKDRNRRYESAGSLARDVERYLHDEPVHACPPSTVYKLKKAILRNKVGVFAGSAVVLALVAGLALATAGFVQARRQAQISAAEAAKATAISELLQTALQSANPDQAKGSDYTVRQLLDDFSGGLADQLVGQREVEAQIRATIGNAYLRLRLFDLAAAQFETALALQRRVDGEEQTKYADILVDYAQILAERDHNIVEAERTAREAIRIYRRAGVSGRPFVKALWILQLQLAYQVDFGGDPARGRSIYAEVQAIVQEAEAIAAVDGAEYPELASMLHRHAPLMSKQGDPAGAEETARRAVSMHRRVHGDEHPETAYGLADLGRVLLDRQKYRDAETVFREAMSIFGRYYGNEDVSGIRDELNKAINAQQHAAETKEHVAEPAEASVSVVNSEESTSANRSLRLAQNALERELRDALEAAEDLATSKRTDNSQWMMLAATYRQVAEIKLKHGKVDDAIGHLRSAVALASRLVSEDPTDSSYAEERARSQLSLAETLARAKRVDESLTAFDAVLAMNEEGMAKSSQERWFIALVVETCARMGSAFPLRASYTPDTVGHLRQLLVRGLHQLDSVDLASDVESSLKVADMYTSVVQNLAAGVYAGAIIRKEVNLYTKVAEKSAADVDSVAIVREFENRLMSLLQATLKRFPNEANAREQVGHRLRLWALALPRDDEYQAPAERALQQAISVFEKLSVDFPNDLHAWHFLADSHCQLGILREQTGKNNNAEAALRRAVELFDEHAAKFDEAPVNNSERARSYFELAYFLTRAERMEEAQPYFRKASDVLEESSEVEADVIEGFARFAYYLGTNHQEDVATEFIKKAGLNAQRVSESNASAEALYYVALVQLRLGNDAGYRATCKSLLEVPYGHLNSAKWRPIWTPCLAPNSLDDFRSVVTRAEDYVASTSQSQRHFGLYVLGAALYRAGQHEQAAERLEESGAAFQSNPLPPGAQFEGRNYQQLLLAMSKWQLGEQDDARRLLAETQPAVETELQSPFTTWNRRATLELLRSEAEGLIRQKEADEAVESLKLNQSTPTPVHE